MDKFMKVTELAARWRVSRMSIYRLIKARELEVVRVGRIFRISVQSVDRYEAVNLQPRVEH